jgi:hypothetical protein
MMGVTYKNKMKNKNSASGLESGVGNKKDTILSSPLWRFLCCACYEGKMM